MIKSAKIKMAEFNERYYYNPFLSDPLCKVSKKSGQVEDVKTVCAVLVHVLHVVMYVIACSCWRI